MTISKEHDSSTAARPDARRPQRGFNLVELMIGATLMAVGLLSISGMFVLVYAQATRSGRTTMGLAAARQVFEDARHVPFDDLDNLNNFDTDDSSSLPAGGPERDVARSLRYALAGDGVGWTFSTSEVLRWNAMASDGRILGARGRINVTAQGADLALIAVQVDVPGFPVPVALSTLISRDGT